MVETILSERKIWVKSKHYRHRLPKNGAHQNCRRSPPGNHNSAARRHRSCSAVPFHCLVLCDWKVKFMDFDVKWYKIQNLKLELRKKYEMDKYHLALFWSIWYISSTIGNRVSRGEPWVLHKNWMVVWLENTKKLSKPFLQKKNWNKNYILIFRAIHGMLTAGIDAS